MWTSCSTSEAVRLRVPVLMYVFGVILFVCTALYGSRMSFAHACGFCLCFSMLLFYATTPEPGAHKTLFSVSSVRSQRTRLSVFSSSVILLAPINVALLWVLVWRLLTGVGGHRRMMVSVTRWSPSALPTSHTHTHSWSSVLVSVSFCRVYVLFPLQLCH